jgi:PEP-CTERM motif-containing protein
MRMDRSFFRLFGILLLGCAAAATGHAGTLLYNNIADLPAVEDDQLNTPLYQSFTSGTTSLQMDDIKLNLLTGTFDGNSFTINLYSDNSNKPNTSLLLIATENDNSLTLTGATYDFSVPDFTLNANTEYWIGLTPTIASINAKWGGAAVEAGDTGTAGQTIDLNGIFFPTNSNFAFYMSIDAIAAQQTTTPEPSSGILFAAGLGAAWWARRRIK